MELGNCARELFCHAFDLTRNRHQASSLFFILESGQTNPNGCVNTISQWDQQLIDSLELMSLHKLSDCSWPQGIIRSRKPVSIGFSTLLASSKRDLPRARLKLIRWSTAGSRRVRILERFKRKNAALIGVQWSVQAARFIDVEYLLQQPLTRVGRNHIRALPT